MKTFDLSQANLGIAWPVLMDQLFFYDKRMKNSFMKKPTGSNSRLKYK